MRYIFRTHKIQPGGTEFKLNLHNNKLLLSLHKQQGSHKITPRNVRKDKCMYLSKLGHILDLQCCVQVT